MEEITIHGKLVAKFIDLGNYITYVFENLEFEHPDDKYIMCVQFPNWDQFTININDVGYVNVRYVKEGVSQWYDGEKFNTYKYTNVIFMKFIKEPNNLDNDYIID